jgi:hypothetical protein
VLLLGQRVGVLLIPGPACLVAYPVANHPGKDDADGEASYHDTPGDEPIIARPSGLFRTTPIRPDRDGLLPKNPKITRGQQVKIGIGLVNPGRSGDVILKWGMRAEVADVRFGPSR